MRSHLAALVVGVLVLLAGWLLWPQTVQSPTGELAAVTVEPKQAEPPRTTTFIFGGDIMLDRYVNHTFKDTPDGSATAFSKLDPNLFADQDIRLANLEGPISAEPIDDNITANNLVFSFPPDTPAALQKLNVTAVSLANNHTSNKGLTGLTNTREVLTSAGIQPIGQQIGFDEDNVWRSPAGGIPTTIIAIDTLEEYDSASLNAEIASEKAAGQTVIMLPHWGYEYQTTHSAGQRALAVEWINAGAALIIGGHPHVVQDAEVINGVPVIYSLGNFVFDQFFSEETQQGMLVGGTLTKDSITLTFYPISLKKMTPQLLDGDTKTTLLERVGANLPNFITDTATIPRPSL